MCTIYTVLHIFRQVLFWAGNQGNHQKYLLFFRDNGITVQILKYQLYCEGFMFLLALFLVIYRNKIAIENDGLVSNSGILYSFVIFVIQPLFYLNGDVNFRNRVLQQGLWKALDRELFQRNTQIQPIAPWGKIIQIDAKCWSYYYHNGILPHINKILIIFILKSSEDLTI